MFNGVPWRIIQKYMANNSAAPAASMWKKTAGQILCDLSRTIPKLRPSTIAPALICKIFSIPIWRMLIEKTAIKEVNSKALARLGQEMNQRESQR